MHPIVSTQWLGEHLEDPRVVIADVRWVPGGPDAGRASHIARRIPGSIFVDLDVDLADVPPDPADGGRHPLPHPDDIASRLAALGIGADSIVIAYDTVSGGIAARLWWMLRWIGHEDAAILDGGLAKWMLERRAVESGQPARPTPAEHAIIPNPDFSMVIDKKGVLEALRNGIPVLDARAPGRFRGENEPLDPVAGHIAGAVNAPFAENLDRQTIEMQSPEQLAARFRGLGVKDRAICQCGSGVTACHNILAMELAGFPLPKLYVGSWSEWCRDPDTPKATGA
ncbi:MAG: sulfurtransferase [Phycisphaeraceae bacterium]|nr:sulfurtransferase [Phycisphaeraceae bacterium]